MTEVILIFVVIIVYGFFTNMLGYKKSKRKWENAKTIQFLINEEKGVDVIRKDGRVEVIIYQKDLVDIKRVK